MHESLVYFFHVIITTLGGRGETDIRAIMFNWPTLRIPAGVCELHQIPPKLPNKRENGSTKDATVNNGNGCSLFATENWLLLGTSLDISSVRVCHDSCRRFVF